MLDPTGNFIISTVDTAPDPADEGLTLTVDPADEGLFTSLIAVGAFNAVVWPFGVEPRISSAEIIRVTDITDGVFTIERGQEGTTARNIATGWSIAVTPTTKMINDIQTDLSSRVPYTGADSDIDINDKSITSVNEINFGNNTLIGSQSAETGNLWLQGASAATALYLFANDASYSAILNISGLTESDKTFTFPNASGTFAITDDIPTDISELTDTTGIIPADISDLTDTTGIITDKADKSNVLELDNTSEFTPDADYEPATKKYADTKIAKTTNITSLNETGIADGEIAVFNLTNKDIRTSNKTLPSGDVVGTSDTQTLTGKTIDGDDNTVQDLPYSAIKSTSRSGSDTTLITGTKGTNGDLAQWNVDGDLVDGPTPPSGAIVGTTDTQTLSGKTLTSPLFEGVWNGWIDAKETWTYVSTDDPTGVFKINADVTGKYSVGMRIKMTNGGNVIYGIITMVGAYSGGYTSITFLHQIDPTDNLALYLLANSAITNNYYSTQKAPFGFPLEPNKWTMVTIDTASTTRATPTANVWYNLGSVRLTVPIGSWRLGYYHLFGIQDTSATAVSGATTLSTANNSESDTDFSVYAAYIGPTGSITIRNHAHREKSISLTSKTTYYLNTSQASSNAENLYSYGAIKPTRVYAECTLL